MRLGILTRYVLSRFLPALALFGLGLTCLLILADLVLRIEKLREASAGDFFGFVARYYTLKLPIFLPEVVPITVLFAAVFTLMRLAKANELVPMMCGGVSLRRVSVPFVAAAVLAVPLLAWTHLSLQPACWRELSVMDDLVRREADTGAINQHLRKGHHVQARNYDRKNRTLSQLLLRIADVAEIECERARCERWDPGAEAARWRFFEGRLYPLSDGRRITEPTSEGGFRLLFEEFGPEGVVRELEVTPADLVQRSSVSMSLTLAEALRRTREEPDVSEYRMQLYGKFTEPFAPVLLLLLGIPFALRAASSRNLFVGLGLSLVVAIAFLSARILFARLGSDGTLPPAAATFGATAALFAAGAALFARIRT